MAEPLNRINLGQYGDALVVDGDGWAMLGDYKVRLVRRDSEGRMTTDNVPNVERIDQYARAFLNALPNAKTDLQKGRKLMFNATHLWAKEEGRSTYLIRPRSTSSEVIDYKSLPDKAGSHFSQPAAGMVTFKKVWNFMLDPVERVAADTSPTPDSQVFDGGIPTSDTIQNLEEARLSTRNRLVQTLRCAKPEGASTVSTSQPPPSNRTQQLKEDATIAIPKLIAEYNRKKPTSPPISLTGQIRPQTLVDLVTFITQEHPNHDDNIECKYILFTHAYQRMKGDAKFKNLFSAEPIRIIEDFIRTVLSQSQLASRSPKTAVPLPQFAKVVDWNQSNRPRPKKTTSPALPPSPQTPSHLDDTDSEVTSILSASDDHVSTVSSLTPSSAIAESLTPSDELFTLSPSPTVEEDEQNNPMQHPPIMTPIPLPESPEKRLLWAQKDLEQMKLEVAQAREKAEELAASIKPQSQTLTRKSTAQKTNNQELTDKALTRALMEQAKKSRLEAEMAKERAEAATSQILRRGLAKSNQSQ